MNHFAKLATAVAGFGLLVGCGSSGNSPQQQSTTQASEQQAPPKPIPPGSPFAKVHEGEGYDEVIAAIGSPTTPPHYYQTGKAWIPFHYGGDNFRATAHWKGVGSITFSSNSSFSSGMSVQSIDPDPNDGGFEPGT